MGWMTGSSQGLLVVAALYSLLSTHSMDGAIVSILLSLLCALLMNLPGRKTLFVLVLGAFLGLGFLESKLLAFLPLMAYLCLMQPQRALYLPLLALPLLAVPQLLDVRLLLCLLLAFLLWYKDKRYLKMQERYFAAVDDSSLRSMKKQGELRSLQRDSEALVKLAVAQERNRIARDIHDHVGHVLSRGILQAQALGLRLSEPALKEDMKALQASLTTGMNAIRDSVHNTRQEVVVLDREIKSLLSAFTFCPVRYTNNSTTDLPLNQKYVVIAIIKEALSNIARHSGASQADITLSELRDSRLLLIHDNGRAAPSAQGGMGLFAMEERVKGLGGSIHISREQGFRILITLPKEEQHEHPDH